MKNDNDKAWTKKWLRWLLVLLLVLAAWGMKRMWFTPAVAPPSTAAVLRADMELSVLATGTIGAAKMVSVGAQATGQVKVLHVRLGDTVRQGQLIAEIDAMLQQNSLRNAKAQVQSVNAQQRAKLAAFAQAELIAKRQRGLVAADAGARADLEAAEAALSTTQAEIEALHAQISQAKIAENTAELNLSYTRVTAPITGIVVAVVTEQGQTVNAIQSAPTIVMLARLETMTVKAQISEADVPLVKEGMPVYFSLLGEPDRRFEAKLRAIEPGPTTMLSESSGASASILNAGNGKANAIYYNGIFDVANLDGKLRINMTAQTTIVLASARRALTVPSAALGARLPDGRYRMRVLQEERIVEKQVRIGLNNRVRAEVLDGLAEGDKVVLGETPATDPRRV